MQLINKLNFITDILARDNGQILISTSANRNI